MIRGEATPAIVTDGLGRSFGPVRALDGFDVVIDEAKVTALVGPNGAGKTTLLLILAGLLAPDRGAAAVGGIDPVTDPYGVHALVGWMPDFFGVYDDLTPREYLELFGAAYKLPRSHAARRAEELLATMKLASMADAPVHTLSRGQKQKLGFARCLVHEPRILLLDEPASGLDPQARADLRDLVRAQADAGVAVVISSHILAELEEMADAVVFVEGGRCRGSHAIGALPTSQRAVRWRLRALDAASLGAALAQEGIEFDATDAGAALVELDHDAAVADLIRRLVGGGVALVEATPMIRALERAFMSLEKSS